ncbi:phosphoglycerate dehydrogenase [Ilumatobacter coccineus]|jgi:D-3-phosphoglycerate dehydrogenase / 2-oxoglutarate reductase|uniref:D-3-phosphoglycerate dehydrogenase n=1 Tax=Ilumatobacter coccineus (strain NBRC 103263 / KCTC 29153 / YM16-304) TaxID=1313172 RepID=A0A6C7DZR6_ILUCY|nr:phosphoglycerate dehydrogenase [Ilumatobacter coccineus]BAN01584.1 D-3-phosphoglycerate dehydrogenase [Ilumatobacter coccineus YM16-304]
MARILVTEEIAEGGLDRLRAIGHDVDVQVGLSPDELVSTIPGASALIIRSATQVTDEVLAAATDLMVVGRAGIGLDNVDVPSATARGVMVVNAPQSNIVSAAEHTMALLLASARNVPQAHAALVEGRWERSKWEGVELVDKTLGVVGLGRIGKLVADRAKGFGMRLVAYDPFVSEDRARQMGVELLELDQLVAESDFLTVHLPKTPETLGLINRDLLVKAKPSLRIINVARGGIVDEADLAECLNDGIVAGAALDVFSTEPMTESPLFSIPSVVVTPHLGASTREAQDKAGDTIATMVELALAGDFVPFAVNVNAAEANETIRPYLPLAERLGSLFQSLVGATPDVLEVCVEGEIAGYDTRILELAVLKGYFGSITSDPVTYVNAPQLAKDRGLEVREVNCATSADYVNLLTIQGGGHKISGTLSGPKAEQRVVNIDDVPFDVPPVDNMVVITNDDRPGVIGTVGTLLGSAEVNIADMDVSRTDDSTAVMLIAPTKTVPAEVLDDLRQAPGIISVITLST